MKYPLSLLILLFLGCEAIVEVDPPEYASEPVVTSFFSPDSTWSVTMHRSLGITDKRDVTREYISDASVTIMNGPNMADILNYAGHGRYISSTGGFPRDGISYTLRVDFPGRTSIQATSAAPSPVIISDYSIEPLPPSPEPNPSSRTAYQLKIVFSDTPGVNFYRIGVYRRVRSRIFGSDETDSLYTLINFESFSPGWSCDYSTDVVDIDPIDGVIKNIFCDEFIVTDRLFDGKDYSWSGTTYELNESGRNELRLIISSLSEDYYKYLQSLERNVFHDPLLEQPSPVYSNVNGGLGVFAGYTNTTLVLPFPKEN